MEENLRTLLFVSKLAHSLIPVSTVVTRSCNLQKKFRAAHHYFLAFNLFFYL